MKRELVVLSLCAFAGCGEVKQDADARTGNPDAPPGIIDAPPIDAPVITGPINSVGDFPSPNTVIMDFSAANLPPGVTGTGYTLGSGALLGNVDAPFATPFMAMTSNTMPAVFTFSSPIRAVGIAAADADFGNDNLVVVTVTGFTETGAMAGTHQRGILPANDGPAENTGALFIGFSSATPFTTVRIMISQANTTMMDHMMFRP